MALINLKDITVSYNGKTDVLKQLNLDIEKGHLVSLLGPSGCGKTTTLRVIAGFIEPTKGQLLFNGKDYSKLPVHKRNFGLVFQSYALFPHLTVFDNIAFGLKLRRIRKESIKKSVDEILKVVDLEDYGARYPKELSGGQRQRVAIARALVIQPDLLLLDEPLSNLDAKLRLKMRVEIKKIQQKFGITTVFVTHDQEECFSISDKVAVLNKGVIEQYDTPEKIYSCPATEFVARFVGFENFIDLHHTDNDVYQTKEGFKFSIEKPLEGFQNSVKGTIRPEDIQILSNETSQADNTLSGIIEVRTFLGKGYQYSIKTNLGSIIASNSSNIIYSQGDKVKLYLPSNKLTLVKNNEEE